MILLGWPTMLLAHFASSGSAALELPSWALAYAVFAASVIVILISRSRHVPAPRPPRPQPSDTAADGSALRRIGRLVASVVAAVLFWVFTAFCWFGPSTLTQNIAPLGLIGVLWALGGWVALVFGWCWEVLDPFALFARRTRPTDQADGDGPDAPAPRWAPLPVLVTWVIVWVAWIAGDEPRHLAVWLTLYGVAMIVVARRGGRTALRAWNPLPVALDLTAAVTRPGGGRARTPTPQIRARIALISALLLGALAANRVDVSRSFVANVADHGELAETLVTTVLFVGFTAVIWGLWRLVERVVETTRGEAGLRPIAATLGTIAGTVLLGQALPAGLIQTQNFLVLISDPFARGWNLFGTVYWEVSPQPISPFTRSLIQVAVVMAGHLATLYAIGHAATERAVDGSTSPAARHRCWKAALPAMALTVVNGVVWTLVVL